MTLTFASFISGARSNPEQVARPRADVFSRCGRAARVSRFPLSGCMEYAEDERVGNAK